MHVLCMPLQSKGTKMMRKASIMFWFLCMGLAVWLVSAESRPGNPDFDGYEALLKNLTKNSGKGKASQLIIRTMCFQTGKIIQD